MTFCLWRPVSIFSRLGRLEALVLVESVLMLIQDTEQSLESTDSEDFERSLVMLGLKLDLPLIILLQRATKTMRLKMTRMKTRRVTIMKTKSK